MWFQFNQNNSGGSFIIDDNVTHRVIIEANSEEEAIEIGDSLGMYWNGCEKGYDCSCCGDRWYSPNEVDLSYGSFEEKEAESIANNYNCTVVDSKYNKKGIKDNKKDIIFNSIETYAQYMADLWGYCDPDIYIYYKNMNKISISSLTKKAYQKKN